MTPALDRDLKKLTGRAFYRAEWAEEVLRCYHAASMNLNAGTVEQLRVLYNWMFVPPTLWPLNVQDVLAEMSDHWGYEDGIYRFYHQSFKVYYRLQPATLKIVEELQALAPHLKLNPYFRQIFAEGTGTEFKLAHNAN